MNIFLIIILTIAGITGCAYGNHKGDAKIGGGPVYYAVAVMNPTKGNKVSGTVIFSEAFGKVTVEASLKGLDKNSKHGFHIHEFGDCTAADGKSAGGHYNPEGHAHGGLNSETHHVGDLGNLVTDAKGNASLKLEIPNMSINGLNNPILGRGVIIHKDIDDLISQPIGGAGDRVACGVIGAAAR